jgi:hypothetical protein
VSTRPHGREAAFGDGDEHFVARPVAELVVDRLEPVAIEEEQGDGSA